MNSNEYILLSALYIYKTLDYTLKYGIGELFLGSYVSRPISINLVARKAILHYYQVLSRNAG